MAAQEIINLTGASKSVVPNQRRYLQLPGDTGDDWRKAEPIWKRKIGYIYLIKKLHPHIGSAIAINLGVIAITQKLVRKQEEEVKYLFRSDW